MAQPPPADRAPADPSIEVQVGVVVGTHANDGTLRIQPETDNPERFRKGATLRIATADYIVERAATGKDRILLVKLVGLDAPEEAVELLHQAVVVPVSAVPTLPEDTYYHYQLLDMTVVDSSGASIGTITEVLSTGANDVYVVTGEETELMVPALADVVLAVDVERGRMTVEVPEGIEPRAIDTKRAPRPAARSRRRKRRPPQ